LQGAHIDFTKVRQTDYPVEFVTVY
jgi:hypothetical protein